METNKTGALPETGTKYHEVPVPEYPKKINLGIQEDYCNLSCPKCLVFGTNKDPSFDIKKVVTSAMPMENIIKILDEVKEHRPTINLSFWVEPLVVKNFKEVVIEVSNRNIPVSVATNGLLVTKSMAEFLVEHVAVVNISIDATTKETLVKTRSTDRLERIHSAVFHLLDQRGDGGSPRVGVNFTVDENNAHERDDFLKYWLEHVDTVRINQEYTYERGINNLIVTRDRTPCREIYDQMTIDFNGEVRMCCLDGFRVTNLGNVFKDGVYNVWHGDALTSVRKHHEDGDYDAESFCKSCTLWASYNIINEREEGNLLIRNSDSITYYNRLDRLNNWKSEIRRNDLKFQPKEGTCCTAATPSPDAI